MLTPSLAAFLITVILIELTPGPNMAYLTMVSAVEGQKSGFATTAGIALGLALVGFAAVLGLAAIVVASPFLFQSLRWAGALYLVWLAAEAWMSATEVSPGKVAENRSARQHFRRGLITNLLNPKAGLFFIAILPGFTNAETPVLQQTLLLTAIYVTIATTVHIMIVMMAGQARDFLSDNNKLKLARKFFAVILIGIAIWFLAASR